MRGLTPEQRFQSKIKDFSDIDACWEWTCELVRGGYGRFWDGKKRVMAHRWSYERATGSPIPDGMVMDHICRTRNCVNPLHLRVVTPRQNILENSVGQAATNRSRTHCIHGHEFNEENTYLGREGHRQCRACQKRRSAEHYACHRP